MLDFKHVRDHFATTRLSYGDQIILRLDSCVDLNISNTITIIRPQQVQIIGL